MERKPWTIERVQKIEALAKKRDISLIEACEKLGENPSQFYNKRAKFKKPAKRTYRKTLDKVNPALDLRPGHFKMPTSFEIPDQPVTNDKVVILVTNRSNVSKVLAEVWRE